MIRLILCKLFRFHSPRPGVVPEYSIRWDCCRCGELVDGGVATRRRNRV